MKTSRLVVDGTLLRREGGAPFFWLADTAWELFHRYAPADADRYLETRAAQGFTVIQAVLLAEEDGLRVPDRLGNVPFADLDTLTPNEAYWQNVDRVVRKANDLGLVMALLPTWGDKVTLLWGVGPVIFTPENAREYGRWVAERYADGDVVWVVGGDRPVLSEDDAAVWRAMAEGIRSSIGDSKLISFHPVGGESSATYVHDEPWLDFNMLQSGHCGRDNPNWTLIRRDLAILPTKPVLDGEPNYEDHPVMGSHDGMYVRTGEYFGPLDIRKSFYRSVLSGACGHTYGCHSVWQGWDPALYEPINAPVHPCMESLELDGASQLKYGRALGEWLFARGGVVANDGLLANLRMEPNRQMVACSFADGIAVYTPVRQLIRLRKHALGCDLARLKAMWFDPRTGNSTPASPQKDGPTYAEYAPEDSGDWVLLLCEGEVETSG
ncbi:MAG: DUF4038 domain-containing protein [Kiritimatiellia bacterium]